MVRDMVDVGEDLLLGSVPLGPVPLLLKVVGEGIGIFQAFDVAACARILVPEPGAADVAAPLERARSESQSAHAVEGIEAAQAAADDRDIELQSVVTSVVMGEIDRAACGAWGCQCV